MKTLSYLNFAIAVVFTVCSFYQLVYLAVRFLKRRRKPTATRLCRYGVLIAARNEEAVIGQLIDSVLAQDYPAELIDIFVVADNCTDQTAQVARLHGATVFKRQNRIQVGKGYALQFLLGKIKESGGEYDGYFVFDADNLLAPDYITEMNRVFSNGARVVTSYRNSKDFGSNWISAGYGLYFLRESEYLNRPRDALGVSCAVSGTGFLMADSLLAELGGWNYFLLTEDLEFTAEMLCKGERIAYCHDAILYDEQPTEMGQSIVQRSRWMRGYFQVMGKHGTELVRTLLSTGRFACYDMLMGSIPTAILTVMSVLVNAVMLVVGICTDRQELGLYFFSVASSLFNSYLVLYALGLLTVLTEHRRIPCSIWRQLRYTFTFPLFIYSFIPAMLLAVFGSAEWKPIRHTAAVSISEITAGKK